MSGPTLVRVVLDGPLCFKQAVLQALGRMPVLVLRSGNLLMPLESLQALQEVRADLEGVLYGGGTITVARTPEPVGFVHPAAYLPSRHVASPNSVTGQFLAQVYHRALAARGGKWLLLEAPPATLEELDREVAERGLPCESTRDALNQALDSLLPRLP